MFIQMIRIALIVQCFCSCGSVGLAVQPDGQTCVSQGILWDLRGLISKLLEVGFDLALKALITLFPLASVSAAFLPISDRTDQIIHGVDEMEVFQGFMSSPFMSQPCEDKPIHSCVNFFFMELQGFLH